MPRLYVIRYSLFDIIAYHLQIDGATRVEIAYAIKVTRLLHLFELFANPFFTIRYYLFAKNRIFAEILI